MMERSQPKESIAITGIGLRYPGGATDVAGFWRLLLDGVDAVTAVPADRWSISKFYHPEPGVPGKTYSKWGGFLDETDFFDARFFGISGAEAEAMDPQQRLLLEAAWHALEDGGVVVDRSAGENIGVFVGVSTGDYDYIGSGAGDFLEASAFSATGGARSIASNRISHFLNLKGPSVSFDTACSSSLVALHHACRSLDGGECESALVGGVNFIIDPRTWIAFCGMSALSADGRCKAFDASADGFVRAEGVGVVLLKPYSKAVRDGDRIYACIRATGCNQDGRTPTISMPDEKAQEALILETVKEAGIDTKEVIYVEAHGTGTSVGDPIEARSIGNALGKGRPSDAPLLMGSVKTNLGHLESGAGIAGLIKAALVLKHRLVPPNLHFREGNPGIDFEGLRLKVPVEAEALPPPAPGQHLYACVNSFGFGGTNAHAILESHDPAPDREASPPAIQARECPPMLLVSAQTEAALKSLAVVYAQLLEARPEGFSSILEQSFTRRSRLNHRLLAMGDDAGSIADELRRWHAGQPGPHSHAGEVISGGTTGVVFVFSGQGSQWVGMGRELFESNPVFRRKIEQCHEVILALGGFNLLEELGREEGSSNIGNTEIAQPAIFAVQVALVDVWRQWGLTPAAVVGHSVGEVAAAHVCGALSLEDAVKVIFHRGDAMKQARGGKMIAVGINEKEARTWIGAQNAGLSLAAVNGPDSVSISGAPEAIAEAFRYFEEREVFCRYVPVDYAFHSAAMDPVRPNLLESLAKIEPLAPTIPFYSTVSGKREEEAIFGPGYWWHNVRDTVRFSDAVGRILDDGYRAFLEIGSSPVLRPSLRQCTEARAVRVAIAHSLNRKEPSLGSLFAGLGILLTSGFDAEPGRKTQTVPEFQDLPPYPFDRERFWKESPRSKSYRQEKVEHPFLADRTQDPGECWHFCPDFKTFPYFIDHSLDGTTLFPSTAYVESALSLAFAFHGSSPKHVILEELEFKQALLLPEDRVTPTVRVAIDETGSAFQIHSSSDPDCRNWKLHSGGRVRVSGKAPAYSVGEISAASDRCSGIIEPADFYRRFDRIGLRYGPRFRGVKELRVGQMEAFARVEIDLESEYYAGAYHLHPALLDSAFQTILAALSCVPDLPDDDLFLPVWIDRVRFEKKAGGSATVHTRITSFDRNQLEADITIVDAKGELTAKVEGFRCRRIQRHRSEKELPGGLSLFETIWKRQTLARETDHTPPLEFFPDFKRLGESLQRNVASLEEKTLAPGIGAEWDRLNEMSCSYMERALLNLGLEAEPGELLSWNELIVRTRVSERHFLQLRQIMRHLVGRGAFSMIDEDSWELRRPLSRNELGPAVRRVLEEHPEMTSEVQLGLIVGEQLTKVLRGESEIDKILFGRERGALVEQFYSHARGMRISHATIVAAVREIVRTLPRGRRIRVLEFGAGGGSCTGHYLAALPAEAAELTFTDVSEAFFAAAEKKLAGSVEVVCRKLDISRSPFEQGFGADYDLVIASNVIHALPDLRAALGHVRDLMRPGGAFLMLDPAVRDFPFLDMVFGGTSGWWSFTDHDLRPRHPCLLPDEWVMLLKDCGFENILTVPDSSWNCVFLARESAKVESFTDVTDANVGDWLVLADRGGRAAVLAETLRAHRQNVRLMTPDEWDGDPGSIAAAVSAGPQPRGIVYLWSLEAPAGDDSLSTAEMEASQEWTIHLPAAITRALIEAGAIDETCALWLATRGALSVLPGEKPDVVQSPLQGMGRVIFNELTEVSMRIVDLSQENPDVEFELLAEEMLALAARPSREEDQIAFRGEGRYLARVVPVSLSGIPAMSDTSVHETPCRITSTHFGLFDSLCLERIERSIPEAGEVEVKVLAAGINFRDVMKALAIYPTTIGDAELLGDEFAGEIVGLGEGVSQFSIGDRVLGCALGSFRSYWTGPTLALCRLPEKLTYLEAATVFTACTTARHALFEIGRLRPGERVLIHSAAGGVGMAAMRLAKKAGAEVFATAGNEAKRSLLTYLGADHVFSSRTLEFADEIMEITRGEGIDLVLNSLAGEAIPKSLKCLREGGRFLEIGKRDIYENSQIGLRPFGKGLSFSSIDLAAGMQSAVNRERLLAVEKMLAEGELQSLPHSVFPFHQPAEVFRFMSQGQHLGKLVLSLEGIHARPLEPVSLKAPVFDENETVLISGGTSGMGLGMAKWFLCRGARHFVLVSRSGHSPNNVALEEFLGSAEEMQASVLIRALDVTEETGVIDLLQEVRSTMPPLRAVVHSAFNLADELFLRMTRDQCIAGTRTKISGAWNLHRATLEDPLKHFLTFSSVASTLGNPGQSNYVAANTFLEELVKLRRADGRPGQVVNLDMILDTGVVSRNREVGDYLQKLGWVGINTGEAVDAIGILMSNRVTAVNLTKSSLGKMVKIYPGLRSNGRFSILLRDSEEASESSLRSRIRQEILDADPESRLELIESFACEQIAKVLRLPPASISKDIALNEQGIDSLMAVELIGRLEGRLSISIPANRMMDGPNVKSLARLILSLLTGVERTREGESPRHEPVANGTGVAMPGVRASSVPDLPESQAAADDLAQLQRFMDGEDLRFAAPESPRRYLLTGATGFLGIYLLRELLRRDGILQVACLIRCGSTAEGESRLREACQRYRLDWDLLEKNRARWEVVCGDLGTHSLGMTEDHFLELAERLDGIVHCGAQVDHLASYGMLRRTNVLGTLELIRLAGTGAPKVFHFASTVAVYSRFGACKSETGGPDDLFEILEGYGQTKAVAEHLLEAARARGLPVTTYRLGPLVGDRASGISAHHDFVWLLLKSCVQLGLAPQSDWNLHLTPVDFASSVMRAKILEPSSGKTMHLFNLSWATMDDLVESARRHRFEIDPMPPGDWVELVRDIGNRVRFSPYAIFRKEFIDGMTSDSGSLPALDHAELDRILEREDIPTVAMDAARLDFYFRFLLDSGFIEDPLTVSKSREVSQYARTPSIAGHTA